MTAVTVDAKWRLSRVEFVLPYNLTSSIMGYGEVLLSETSETTPEISAMLRQPRPLSPSVKNDSKVYGAMPSAVVSRMISEELLAEEIEVDGETVDFKTVMLSLERFMEKWRTEDAAKPPATLLVASTAVTPIPVGPPPQAREDELPPPVLLQKERT